MSTTQVEPDLAPYLERCFLFDAVEDSYDISGIMGRIPQWLRGSYYVNGPARFQRGSFRYSHWLDGDGMICAVHFGPDSVRFANRFVQTTKLREEDAAGAPIYRGFGTAWAGDRLRRGVMLEPPLNVSVYPFAGAVLAFGEQSLPYELDPVTLETRGEFDFHGRLNELSPFAAHAKIDAATGHMFNFGISYSAVQPSLHVYEFDSTGDLLARRRHLLEFPHSNHDFGMTAEHVVFFLSPQLMNFDRFRREGVSVFDTLTWEPEKGSRILIAPRVGGEAFTLRVAAGYCLHLINCFEENGRLIVDIIELEKPIYPEYKPIPDLFATAPPGRPVRYVIDLESRAVVDRITMRYDRAPDFPNVDYYLFSRSYEHFWMLGISAMGQTGRKFFNQLAHGSWREGDVTDLYEAAAGEYLAGEPVFIGNPEAPDEGVVIVQHLIPAEGKAEMLLFDAFAVQRGPTARLPLKHFIHPGFHAAFRPDAVA